jgi:hypothetical protein
MDQTAAEGPKYIDKSNIKDGVFTKANLMTSIGTYE